MGQPVTDILRNFAGGVNTTKPADELNANESPRAWNTDIYQIGQYASSMTAQGGISPGGEKAVVRKRKGASISNATPITGSPAIIGQYAYRKFANLGGTYTLYHLLVSATGRLDILNSDGTTSAADAGDTTPFTSGDFLPDFASANNMAFMVNKHGDSAKYNGTNVQNFGIVRPTVGTMAITDSTVSGLHNGTYEARVTFYNANTGQESSSSDSTTATVTVTNKKLTWANIPTSSDTQVTARRLYLRNTATMTNFYQAGVISDNTTTTFLSNVADANLVILSPDIAENNPPPPNIQYIEAHLSRLFVSDGANIYYSKTGFPEAFDPNNTEPVNANDSDQITGIHSAAQVLMIFKRTQLYALVGTDPASWSIQLISGDVGCVAHRSVVTVEGITYWWSLKGPMAWDGEGLPKPIGTPVILPTIDSTALNYAVFDHIAAEVDLTNEHVMFAVPTINSTRNDIMLPFNYRIGIWESDRWNPFDVASMAQVEDANKIPWVRIGSYSGQVFQWWNDTNDAVPTSCTRTGVITAATGTTITDSAAAFTTTGGKLVDRYVYILDAASVNIQRLRITANTSTVLTVDSGTPITGTVTGLTYIVGGPGFSYDTGWIDSGLPFHKKRREFLYTEGISDENGVMVVTVFLDFDDINAARTFSIPLAGSGGTWDSSLWDQANWGEASTIYTRSRVGRTSRVWRVRVANYFADQDIVVNKIGMRSELLTDKT